MRILYLSQWFEPEPNNSKTETFLRGLQTEGHSLTVCTGFPNYPGGKLYPGYRIRPFQRERLMGFDVHRVPLYPSHGASSLGRIANYLSFFVSALLYGLLRGGRFDLAYVYHPPITTGLAAALYGWVRRLPFVLEIQDLWPDSVVASDMAGTSRLSQVLNALCNFTYARAAAIVVQCPGMRDRLIERGVPAGKVHVIYNWTDEDAFDAPVSLTIPEVGAPDVTTIVYAGNMGRAQTVETIVRAARLARDRAPQLRVLIIGDGVEEGRLRALAAEIGADNVVFHDRVSRAEVASLYPGAAGLVVSLTQQDLFAYVIPTKVQTYLAAGRPILVAVNGDAARLVAEAGAGIAVPPEQPQALAEAMLALVAMSPAERDAMGARGARYYRNHLSYARGMEATLAVIGDAARMPGARP